LHLLLVGEEQPLALEESALFDLRGPHAFLQRCALDFEELIEGLLSCGGALCEDVLFFPQPFLLASQAEDPVPGTVESKQHPGGVSRQLHNPAPQGSQCLS
jgi:hypothetical protein